MPYITTEKVAEIRKQIKNEFPIWKFSIVRHHMSSVNIAILESPLDFSTNLEGRDYTSINTYYIHENFTGEKKDALMKIKDIAAGDIRTVSTDADYGNIPNYYFHLTIGEFEKPFVHKPTSTKPVMIAVNPTTPIETANDITLIDYSERAIVVYGEGTKLIKDQLIGLRGSWNAHLTHPETKIHFKGWVFPKTKKEAVQNLLNVVNNINA